jgi:hypothetical protein
MTKVAIMQPTYLPWIGYFGLMDSVDIFIHLDSVQFAKRSWQQRNQIKTEKGPTWLTVSVLSKGLRDQKITDVRIDLEKKSLNKQIRTIELAYSKTPYFRAYADGLFAIMALNQGGLSKLNIELIKWLRKILGIQTPLICASELETVGTKASLLLHLCQQVNGEEYISPPSSEEYLSESSVFKNAGIPIRYFKFNHPKYQQRYGEFISHMSIIDLLFNEGPRSMEIIQKSCIIR